MKYLRLLLFPFSLVYGIVVIIRNWCYDTGIFKSQQFNLPVIAVGNLDAGGAGKSPMTEYLIRLFKDNYTLATLSRGYGRQTNGYLVATTDATATLVGDEPAQFKHKFPGITVAVCENRVVGITRLQPNHHLIILDDAYQHRAVKPGYSLLLFDYNRLNELRLLLPAGNLREPFSGRKRANIIIITKCPEELTNNEQAEIINRVKPFPNQQLFFTSIAYKPLQDMAGNAVDTMIDKDTTVFLLTGIANADPLVQHIKKQTPHIIHHNYPDHYRFSLKNITKLANEFSSCTSKKAIVTTEKDAQRLREQELLPVIEQLHILVLPVEVKFLNSGQQQFDQLITDYVREYTKHSSLH